MSIKKVFICEDHTIVLDGLKLVLNQLPDFQIAGHTSTGADLFDNLKKADPHILILDLNLPDIDGLTLLEKIRSVNKEILVIVLTMYNDEQLVERARRMGANAYLLKNVSNDELKKVLTTANQQSFYISESLKYNAEKSKIFRDQFVNKMKLTEREIEIIRFLARGNSSADIASALHLSTHTINTHRKNILRKLEMNSTIELVHFAHDNNLL
jgi:DNA-binding NarL/FixJ family response regulator